MNWLRLCNFRLPAALLGLCAVLAFVARAESATAQGQEPAPSGAAPFEKQIREIGKRLDDVEREIEAWGQGAVTDFVLLDDRELPTGRGRFEIGYTQPATFYADRVRETIQGTAAATDERTFDTSLRAKMSSDALIEANRGIALQEATLRAEWMKRLLANLEAGTNYTLEDLARFKSLVASNDLNHPPASLSSPPPGPLETSNAFAPAQALVASRGLARVSEDSVTKIAASHKMTELVLNYMSHPVDLPGNKRAFFALTQISLSPGWRTKRGYSAEIQVRLNYAASKAHMQSRRPGFAGKLDGSVRKDFEAAAEASVFSSGDPVGYRYGGGRVSPSVFSAFPLAEAQIFDLRSSYRSQTTFLLQLAGVLQQAGYKVDGEVLLRHVRRFQKDLNTASVLPVVVPTAGPNGLAYRFDPEVMALAEPAERHGRAGELLLPTSFPALIVVVADRTELGDWSHLEMVVETRWIPTEKRHWFKQGAVDWWLYSHMPALPRSNTDRGLLSLNLDEVNRLLGVLAAHAPGTKYSDTYVELKRRYESLRPAGLGRTYQSELPLPPPRIVRWGPATVPVNSDPTFQVFGERLDDGANGTSTKLTLGGVPLTVTSSSANELRARFGTIDGKFPAALEPGAYDLELEHPRGGTVVAKAVTVRAADPADPCPEVGSTELKVTGIQPRRGYGNGTTWLTVTGTGFRPKGKDPVRTVVVGGLMCTNVVVLTDGALVVEVPARFGKLPTPYADEISTPAIVLLSRCRAGEVEAAHRVKFDLEAGAAGPAGAAALDPSLLEKARLLQQASALLTTPSRLEGSLNLSVRSPAAPEAGSEPAASTSAVIHIGNNPPPQPPAGAGPADPAPSAKK